MRTPEGTVHSLRQQFRVYALLAAVVFVFTAVLLFLDTSSFQLFFGNIPPLLAVLLMIALGAIFFFILLSKQWFVIYKKENAKGLWYAAGLALFFGIAIILFDLVVVFSAGVPFPQSLVFYPVMGFVAEVVFHLLPLTVVLVVSQAFFKKAGFEKRMGGAIFVAALAEPIFQMYYSTAEEFPLWAMVLTGIHVFLISLSQLILFRRYDFVTMYSMRLMYYLIWHIGWGMVRVSFL